MPTPDHLVREYGVFLTRDALARRHDKQSIAGAVRRGEWTRVRSRGAFAPSDLVAAARPEERHLARAAAVALSYGDRVAFSHVTAALLHGIDAWGLDLSRVHVTRLDGGAGRTEPDVVHHEGLCLAASDVVRVRGCLATAPARAALEAGSLGTTEAALVVLDSALHRGMVSASDIGGSYAAIEHWPGTRHLQVAVRMADARAESVGESRARWMFFAQGVPAPTLQHVVRDETGRVIGITDFAWLRHRLLGEFDGRVKYGRLLRPGQDAGDAVFAEKRREDEVRRTTQCAMVRVIWPDLDRPVLTSDRVRALMQPG